MFCSQCGTKLPDNSKFCHQCGQPITKIGHSNIIRLRCEECDGIMNVDESHEVISCPFCGSKKVILDSDSIKIEKIRNAGKNARKRIDRDIEQIRANRDIVVSKGRNFLDIVKALPALLESAESLIIGIIGGILFLIMVLS